MRRRAGAPKSENRSLPLTSSAKEKRRKQGRKRDYSPLLLLGAFLLGAFLTLRLFTKRAPTDATTIPNIYSFLKQGSPVAAEQYAVFVTKGDGTVDGTRTALGRSSTSAMDALQTAQRHLPASTARHPWVKVDVVTEVIPVSKDWSYRDKLPNEPDWWFGFALDWDSGWAFSPDEVNSQVLVDYHDHLRWDRIGQYAPKRGLGGWPIPDDMVDDNTHYDGYEYILTNTIFCDFSQQVLNPIPLYHGHHMYPKLTSSLLLEKAISAGRHLTKSVGEDGSMLYIYNPRSGTSLDDENLTHHSSALFAMACLYQVWKDPDLLGAIERGLDYILNLVKPCPIPDEPKIMGKCVFDRGEKAKQKISKLGENALTLLAIAQYMDATGGDTRHLQVARDMAAYIVGSQKDDGSFFQKIIVKPKLELDKDASVRYYQSEAMFALAKLYRIVTKYSLEAEEEWMTVASQSALYIVAQDAKDPDDDLTNDHWLLYGIGEMNPIYNDTTLQQHALRTARVAHEHQTSEDMADSPDRLGIFYGGLSVTSTATYTEGLCAVYDMALDIGAHADSAQIFETITLATRYQLQAQHGPETAMHMKDPLKIVGAFHDTMVKTDMRNDCTQHNLSSMLCFARILKSRGN